MVLTSAATPSQLRVGLGCGSLGSELNYRRSCALIEAAYDCGFRYFDVAPSYGAGLAERIVGDVLAPVRETVTLVTKAGIPHPNAGAGFRFLRRLALPVKKMFPSVWKAAAGKANRAVSSKGHFGPAELEASLAESLRRLRTETVDALLLHEVLPSDIDDALLTTLSSWKDRGMVRSVGIGTSVEASIDIVSQYTARFDVVQANHHWAAFVPLLSGGLYQLVTHRSLRTGQKVIATPEFQRRLAGDAAVANLGAMLTEPAIGPDLLLSAALAQNRTGRLLVASTKIERVRQFAVTAREPLQVPEVAALNRVFADLSRTLHIPDA